MTGIENVYYVVLKKSFFKEELKILKKKNFIFLIDTASKMLTEAF